MTRADICCIPKQKSHKNSPKIDIYESLKQLGKQRFLSMLLWDILYFGTWIEIKERWACDLPTPPISMASVVTRMRDKSITWFSSWIFQKLIRWLRLIWWSWTLTQTFHGRGEGSRVVHQASPYPPSLQMGCWNWAFWEETENCFDIGNSDLRFSSDNPTRLVETHSDNNKRLDLKLIGLFLKQFITRI